MKKTLLLLSTILITFASFANIQTGRPNVKISGSLGLSSLLGVDASIGIQPEWTAKFSNDWEIGFGPVFDINAGYYGSIHFASVGAGVTLRFDAKKKLNYNKKIYFGAEGGLKFQKDFYLTNNGTNGKLPTTSGIFKINTGVEYRNGFYIGGFLGYGKGNIGLELGYRTR
ncbi:hypothetical protein [Caviibacter abscessus]|uniref:hypothetical protein n=1 Tax=Caviibacter abscessus TaxID=1766719 RepID=UPI00083197C9|nr:hypothetical protein [Caviibacter abscessus]